MPVLMMHIWNVRVLVLQALVTMDVRVRLARRIVRSMLVLVMLVVDVGV
jgi:hypothetical protein